MTSVVRQDNPNESGLGRPLPLKLSRIERFEGQPRRFFDPKSIEELANSLQSEGQKVPVNVCKHPSKSGIFVLIGGERRWRAFHLIKERTGQEQIVDVLVNSSQRSYQDHYKEAVIDNLHREDLIPVDEAAAYHQLYTDGGMTKEAISKMVGKSYAYVDNYIRLHSLPDEVKALMDPARSKDDRLSITAAIDIARSIPNKKLQITVAKESIERSLGVAEVRTLIQVRTGNSGYGVGGRLRRPSDDYKVLKVFIGNTQRKAARFVSDIFVDGLYRERDDEAGDRRRDAAAIRHAVHNLELLLKEVEGGK